MFIDTANITVRAGRGGDGAVSFHREKYISHGGPDGGDGGRGGHVYMQADSNLSTLMDFHYNRKFAAQDGAPGSGKGCTGRSGADLIIPVPVGTLVRDRATGAVIRDLSDTEPFQLAKGGRGGWGNKRFATATRQCPRFAKPGLDGEEYTITLELKLLADVGLVGFPNAGKSTLLSVMSAARPKIAGYPFTTLVPNLGVARVDEGTSFVVSDIPGLIEGAATGAGLGHEFLRHVERCRLLAHVVDISGCEGRNPIEDYDAVRAELEAYSPELAGRPCIVVANKCDLLTDDAPLAALRAHLPEDLPLLSVSGATRSGVDTLVGAMAQKLQTLPPQQVFESNYVAPAPEGGSSDDLVIRTEGDVWIIEGLWLSRLLARVNLSDYESRMYFDRMLRQSGLFKKLEKMGIQEGDTVSLYDCEFEYVK